VREIWGGGAWEGKELEELNFRSNLLLSTVALFSTFREKEGGRVKGNIWGEGGEIRNQTT